MSGPFSRRDDGNVMTITALCLPVLLLLCGLIIDEASLQVQRRALQNAADMAAISGAGVMERADATARAVLVQNGIDPATQIMVETGRYSPDASLAPAERFATGGTADAVRVTLTTPGRFHFGLGRNATTITRSATATARPQIAWSLGSRLASLEGGAANALLSALTGSEITLSAMDYKALAAARVELPGLLAGVADEANITAVTYDDVLDAPISLGTLAAALTLPAASDTDPAAAHAMAASIGRRGETLRLRQILDLGGAGKASLGSALPRLRPSLLSTLTAGALVAGGERQVSVDLDATVPALADISVDLAIGEPPQQSGLVAVGSRGAGLKTAQTRLRLTASVADTALPSGALLQIPLYLELASAEANVASVTCSLNGASGAALDVAPGIAALWIGDIPDTDFMDFSMDQTPAEAVMLDLPLIDVSARAQARLGSESPMRVTFTPADIDAGSTKTAQSSGYTSSLTGSLLNSLDIEANVAGLGLSLPGGIAPLATELTGDTLEDLDGALQTILAVLGIGLGEADVTVHDVTCSGAALVH